MVPTRPRILEMSWNSENPFSRAWKRLGILEIVQKSWKSPWFSWGKHLLVHMLMPEKSLQKGPWKWLTGSGKVLAFQTWQSVGSMIGRTPAVVASRGYGLCHNLISDWSATSPLCLWVTSVHCNLPGMYKSLLYTQCSRSYPNPHHPKCRFTMAEGKSFS